MGRCDSTNASIGIKILLYDLISQMNDTNIDIIKNMLYTGCIEDDNDCYNEVYQSICEDIDNVNLKEHLLRECSKVPHSTQVDVNDRYLLDRYLLVPIKNIISTQRWGYNREGTNSNSRPLDFDLLVNTEEYKDITNYTIVFFITQHAA